jgi:hypothetical protein
MSREPQRHRKTVNRDALRARYRAERDKRVRPDGNEQYIEPKGRYAHFLDDPWSQRVAREPRFDEVTGALIGGGFSGLCTGSRQKQAGVEDVWIIEGAAMSVARGTGIGTPAPCATPRR